MSTKLKHSPFKRISKNRLRVWLMVFFIALMIPTALLILQAYQELRWESFHQRRVQAEELAARIDVELQGLIDKEQKRAFSDYAFLNITGTEKTNFLQRSPLANYPVTSDIPGLLGYFQVESDGQFTTPLLPDDPVTDRYGLAADEVQQRLALQLKLLGILDTNQLVERKLDKPEPGTPMAKKRLSDATPMEADDVTLTEGISSSFTSSMKQQRKDADFYAPLSVIEESETRLSVLSKKEVPLGAPMVSQQAFDQLGASTGDAPMAKDKIGNKLDRVLDLKLDRAFEDRADRSRIKKQMASEEQAKMQNLPSEKTVAESKVRLEISRLPGSQAADESNDIAMNNNAMRILSFESAVDSFELSLLDSGHFVLFRKVWRDEQRIIQGLLIEKQPFIDGIIKTAFSSTALSGMSHLVVAWQGNVISRLQANDYGDYLSSSSNLNNTLLYQTALTQPLGDLELVFSINRLPVGAGATVINWIAGILLFIMMLGFYLLYRSGVRHIHLLQQQQDFVSAVSHEFKTPLTSIRMYGEMLQQDWAPEDKKKNYYDLIVSESARLTRLINNVLQLARFSRNAIQSDLIDIKLNELMDLTRSAVDTAVQSAGFSLDLQCGDTTGQQLLHVDTDHFIQIMINLIDNALKFSAAAENKNITLSCQQTTATQLQISVRDYGPGIPKNQMKKIFTLFYRAENELTRETVGTGIGLALVNQLMREMDAEIDVHNTNPGVQFSLLFTCSPGKGA